MPFFREPHTSSQMYSFDEAAAAEARTCPAANITDTLTDKNDTNHVHVLHVVRPVKNIMFSMKSISFQ